MAALFLALAGIGLLAGPASAHAQLLGTDPAAGSVLDRAPTRATLRFNEPIRVVRTGVHLFTADGAELHSSASSIDDRVEIALPGALADGTYTVAWRVISSDGHPIAGALVFSVGAPSARVSTPDAAASTTRGTQIAIGAVQALVYLGVFLAIGLVIFSRLLLPRDADAEETRSRLLKVARRGADVGFLSSLLLLPLTTINQRGDHLSAIFAARSWQVDLGNPEPQAAILVMFGLALAVMTSANRRLQVLLPLVGGTLALGSLALVGHTRSFGPAPLVISADVAHVLAGSVWFGGLVGLTISLKHLRDSPALAGRTVSRFSTVAAGLLAVVTVTGTTLAWRILGSFSGFVETSFGRALLVKLGLVALVITLAAINRWKLLPEMLRRAASGEVISTAAASDRLRRAVRVEGLILVAVLGVTGVLVDRTPESTSGSSAPAAVGTTTATARADDTRVTLDIDPARVGSNTFAITLTDAGGSPLTPYEEPSVTLVHGDLRLADQALLEHGPGIYHAEAVLPKSGKWVAEVTVRTSEFDSRVIAVRFTVGR